MTLRSENLSKKKNFLVRLYEWLESLSSRSLTLLLIVVGITFMIIGLVSGTFLIGSGEVIKDQTKPLPRTEVITEDKSPRDNFRNAVTYSGLVSKNTQDNIPQATYSLKDEDGEVIVYLTTNDDKLLLSEGLIVEVVGEVIDSIDSIPLLMVREVVFK